MLNAPVLHGSLYYMTSPGAPVVLCQIVLYLGIAAFTASVYDIVHNHFVKLTSSMNMAIMGNSKVTQSPVVKSTRACLACLLLF